MRFMQTRMDGTEESADDLPPMQEIRLSFEKKQKVMNDENLQRNYWRNY